MLSTQQSNHTGRHDLLEQKPSLRTNHHPLVQRGLGEDSRRTNERLVRCTKNRGALPGGDPWGGEGRGRFLCWAQPHPSLLHSSLNFLDHKMPLPPEGARRLDMRVKPHTLLHRLPRSLTQAQVLPTLSVFISKYMHKRSSFQATKEKT